MQERRPLIICVILFGIALLLDIVLIHIIVLFKLPQQIAVLTSKTQQTSTVASQQQESTGCDETCQALFTSQIETLKEQVQVLETKKQVAPTKAGGTTSTTKEFFVPMGSGRIDKNEWTDIAGTDVFIDTANFPRIKTVYFEASMHIPTKNGEVSARLYNVSDKHPVWYSDVSTTQDTSTFLSSVISLTPGNKQYRIQMKTSLQYESVLDTARIKILLQ